MYILMKDARKMLASVLMFVLAASLATDSAFARPSTDSRQAGRLREQVAHLAAGAMIEVRFLNREKIRGRLGAVEADGFTLRIEDGSASERRVAFTDVRSIQAIQSTRGKVAVWIVAGVLVAVVVVALALFLKYRHNE